MTLYRTHPEGCDALDVAAMWPSPGQIAAFPVPEIEAGPRRPEDLPRRRGGDRF